MKTKLIQTKDYLLLIDEEAEIKEDDLLYEEELDVIFNIQPYGLPCNNTKTSKIVSYCPLTKEAKELDLPLLPPFEKDIDMEELFYENCKNLYDSIEEQNIAKLCFYKGYKAA